jgi:hypothetical protein
LHFLSQPKKLRENFFLPTKSPFNSLQNWLKIMLLQKNILVKNTNFIGGTEKKGSFYVTVLRDGKLFLEFQDLNLER